MSERGLTFGRPQHRRVKTGDPEDVAFQKYFPVFRIATNLFGVNDLKV